MAPRARYTERLLVVLSPEQKKWLVAEADRRGISAAQVVREAIDEKRKRGR